MLSHWSFMESIDTPAMRQHFLREKPDRQMNTQANLPHPFYYCLQIGGIHSYLLESTPGYFKILIR